MGDCTRIALLFHNKREPLFGSHLPKGDVIDISEIKAKIKEIIFHTSNINPEKIQDNSSFLEDLQLDSLTLMEIAVNVDQAFEVDMPDEEMQRIISVQATAELIVELLNKKALV